MGTETAIYGFSVCFPITDKAGHFFMLMGHFCCFSVKCLLVLFAQFSLELLLLLIYIQVLFNNYVYIMLSVSCSSLALLFHCSMFGKQLLSAANYFSLNNGLHLFPFPLKS